MGHRSGHRLVRPEKNSLQCPLPTRRLLRSALGEQLLLSCPAVGHCDLARPHLLDDVGSWRSTRCLPIPETGSTSSMLPTISGWSTAGPSCSDCRSLAGGRRTRLGSGGPRSTFRGCVLPAILLPILGNLHPISLVSMGAMHWSWQPLFPPSGSPLSHDRLPVRLRPSTGHAS